MNISCQTSFLRFDRGELNMAAATSRYVRRMNGDLGLSN